MGKRRDIHDDHIEYVENGQYNNTYILPLVEGQGEILSVSTYYDDPPLSELLVLGDYTHL